MVDIYNFPQNSEEWKWTQHAFPTTSPSEQVNDCPSFIQHPTIGHQYASSLDLSNLQSHLSYNNTDSAFISTPINQNSDSFITESNRMAFQNPQSMNYFPSTSGNQMYPNGIKRGSNFLRSNSGDYSDDFLDDSSDIDDKSSMHQQILTIIEQQGPTANGKRKRIKKGTLSESQKLFLRRERNRLAATKCREKRKYQSQSTKQKYEEYSDKNKELEYEIEKLEKQRKELVKRLRTHNCVKAH